MQCKICLENFDQSKHLPYCLLPCCHTFCLNCLLKQSALFTTCPKCNTEITGKSPNWDLKELVPESEYDKLRSQLQQSLNEISDLKKNCDKLRAIKIEENLSKINLLNDEINSKAEELINSIQSNRNKLLNDTKNIEDYLSKKINELKINNQIEIKTKDAQNSLDTNDLTDTEILNLKADISAKKSELSNKIDQLEKFENNYEFLVKTEPSDQILGQISNNKWLKKPIQPNDYINLGKNFHEQLKDYKTALDYYNKAIEIDPKNSLPIRNKGLIYYELKDYDAALKCYDQAIETEPSNKNSYIGKSNVLKALKNYEGAIDCYQKVINMDPSHVISYYSKGIIFKEEKKFDEAIQCFDKTIEINPNYTSAYYSKGLILKEQKEYLDAIDCFNSVLRIDPFYLNAYLSKGLALKELKNNHEALEQFNKALEIDSNFIVAHNSKMSLLKMINQSRLETEPEPKEILFS